MGRLIAVYSGAVALAFLVLSFRAVSAGQPVAAILLGAILLIALLFFVRGYSVSDDRLIIHHLVWATTFDLSSLSNVRLEPDLLRKSISLWSTRGLFGIVGHLKSKAIGHYRAYATTGRNAVLLDFGDERVVVTPERPQEFMEAVARRSQK
jgi:hypothetical protein